jgi:CHAT domain-containing protein
LLKPVIPADGFQGILAVGQEATVGHEPLPGTVNELDEIEKLVGKIPFTRLERDQATCAAVINAMEQHSWVHLACHASQNTSDPTKSAFQLHGGELDLATITQKSLKHARLAFLSACETATGDNNLPEEAVHLAAGMIMAGYPTVIATMWSIKDEDAPQITKEVYAHLLADGVLDARRVAMALHNAVRLLRETIGERCFARWVPYIHIGK